MPPIRAMFRALLACALLALPSYAVAQDPCSVLAQRLKARPDAVDGLGVWIKAHRDGMRDPGAFVADLELHFGSAIEDTLESMKHIRQADGLDRFVFEMTQDHNKAASTIGTLLFLRRRLPGGVTPAVKLEVNVGSGLPPKRVDLVMPDGNSYDFKVYDWNDRFWVNGVSNNQARDTFRGMLQQVDEFIAGATRDGKRFTLVFDSPMPPALRAIFESEFGERLSVIGIEYLSAL